MPGITDPLSLNIPDRFETERLILRAQTLDNLDSMQTALEASHKELNQWLPFATGDEPQPRADTAKFIRRAMAGFIMREMFGYALFSREDGHYIGNIGVHPKKWHVPSFEIGYWINTREAGKGYMTEAAQCLTDYFINTVGARRMMIRCDSRNRASASVALKCGYTLEGVSKHNTRDNRGQLVDMETYSIAIPDEA